MTKTHLLENSRIVKTYNLPVGFNFKGVISSSLVADTHTHTHVTVSLCLNRDEPSGPGNLALIQLLLKAKQLIRSLAEAEIQLAHKAQVTIEVWSRKYGSKIQFKTLKRPRPMGKSDKDYPVG